MNWTDNNNFGTRNRKKMERVKMSVYMNRQKEFKKQMESKGQSIYSINDKEITKSSSDFKRLKTIIGSSLRLQYKRKSPSLNHEQNNELECIQRLQDNRNDSSSIRQSISNILEDNIDLRLKDKINRLSSNHQINLTPKSNQGMPNLRLQDNRNNSPLNNQLNRSSNVQSISSLRLQDSRNNSPLSNRSVSSIKLPDSRQNSTLNHQTLLNLSLQDNINKSQSNRKLNYESSEKSDEKSDIESDDEQSISSLRLQNNNESSFNRRINYETEDNQSAVCESRSDELDDTNLQNGINSQLNNNLSQSNNVLPDTEEDLFGNGETDRDSDYFSFQVSTLASNPKSRSSTRFF